MNYESLSVRQAEGVAWIVINRPHQLNALNLSCVKELFDASNRLSEEPAVRAVILTGAGDRAFCVGGDVAEIAKHASGAGLLLKEMTAYLHLAVARLRSMAAPVIAAVNGVAAGAGLGLVAAADLAIASDQARFTSAYTQIGLNPDAGTSYFLPRLVGLRRAAELMLTNRTLSAAKAQDWGLVNQVVAQSECLSKAERLAERLAAGPTGALGRVKRLIETAEVNGLVSQLDLEARLISEASLSRDGQEGIAAFMGKRKPRFGGL